MNIASALLGCACFATATLAQVPVSTSAAQLPAFARSAGAMPLAHVLHDATPDGALWAVGATWKASFDRGGFTYVPRLTDAPHDCPVAFRVAAVTVGGESLPFATDAAPRRIGDRIVFDRGCLQEVYDLSLDGVEQTFVVDSARRGDVDIELAIATDLVEDATRPGLQFACAFGAVSYSDAFVVCDGARTPIATDCAGSTLRLRVPAELRGDGPVVVDPVLGTQTASSTGQALQPDVAFDVTNGRYLLTWEFAFSSTDHDVFCQLFDAAGLPIADTTTVIDASTANATWPRVANLDAADRFLVAFTYADPANGNRRMAFGRTRDAGGATDVGPYVLFSDPALPGENSGVDVGADSGTGPGNHDWLVVWVNAATISDSNIHGRTVLANGQPRDPNVLLIEFAGTQFNANVQVSRGNGNGYVDHPQWLVVYSRYFGATVAEVHCRTVDPDGVVGAELPLDTGNRALYPQVSSPLRADDRAAFLVTYRRESPAVARAVVVRFDTAWHGSNFFDLTQQFGVQPDWSRPESDGARFVLASKNFFAQQVDLRTLAWTGANLVEQDLVSTTSTDPTEVASCRTSGGAAGFYAIALLGNAPNGGLPRLARYGGYAQGAQIDVRATGCNGLAIGSTSSAVLGATMQFDLSNYGAAFPAFAFGGAAIVPIPICPTCALGLRLDLPIDVRLGDALAIAIPNHPALVGEAFGVQGVAVGGGTCLGGLGLSDTVQFTIR